MNNRIKWFAIGTIVLAVMGGLLLWQGQKRLADHLLTRYLPELQYRALTLDSTQGQLALQGVKIALPGIMVTDGSVEVQVDPATLLHGPIVVEKIILHGLQATVDPTKFSSFSAPSSSSASSSTTIGLPRDVLVQGAVITIITHDLPHVQPLHLDGKLSHLDQAWALHSTLQLAQGAIEADGKLTNNAVKGVLQVKGTTIQALLQQIGIENSSFKPQGQVDGTVRWVSPLSAPDKLQATGKIQLHGGMATAQQHRQKIGDVTVKLAWQGAKRLLQLQQVEVHQSHFIWSHKLSATDGGLDLSTPFSIHWRLEHFRMVDGKLDLNLLTAAGTAFLPLRLTTLELHNSAWNTKWPQHARFQGTLAKGKMDISLNKHQLLLDIRRLPLGTLEPLLITSTGLRIPKGDLSLHLRGEVDSKLKLFGGLTLHQLVLAPRIPVSGVDLSIPYKLGLRALTNNGITYIPLAIRGTITRPDVDIAQIITEVKKNLFNGALDGKLHHFSIDFLAKKRRLTPTGEKTIEQLIRLLREDQTLKVTMRGCVDTHLGLAPQAAQRLAAARVKVVQAILKRKLHRQVGNHIICPRLTDPSPDIPGKNDRVEVTISP